MGDELGGEVCVTEGWGGIVGNLRCRTSAWGSRGPVVTEQRDRKLSEPAIPTSRPE